MNSFRLRMWLSLCVMSQNQNLVRIFWAKWLSPFSVKWLFFVENLETTCFHIENQLFYACSSVFIFFRVAQKLQQDFSHGKISLKQLWSRVRCASNLTRQVGFVLVKKSIVRLFLVSLLFFQIQNEKPNIIFCRLPTTFVGVKRKNAAHIGS